MLSAVLLQVLGGLPLLQRIELYAKCGALFKGVTSALQADASQGLQVAKCGLLQRRDKACRAQPAGGRQCSSAHVCHASVAHVYQVWCSSLCQREAPLS